MILVPVIVLILGVIYFVRYCCTKSVIEEEETIREVERMQEMSVRNFVKVVPHGYND